MGSVLSGGWGPRPRLKWCVDECWRLIAKRGGAAVEILPPPGEEARALAIEYVPERRAFRVGGLRTIDGATVEEVSTQQTRLPTGGLRTWLTCPKCGRRVGRLYIPPRGIVREKPIRCWHCHGLASHSSGHRVSVEESRFRRMIARLIVWRRAAARHPSGAPAAPAAGFACSHPLV